ncbi:SusC/RagA family TonB-linked outer membrane protein [Mucilaginibacter sp. HD30]
MKNLYYLLILLLPLIGRGQSISGTVTDQQNEPVPGVTVTYPGTRLQSATDEMGHFMMPVTSGLGVLRFTFTGMTTQEVDFTGKKEIRVVMLKSNNKLDEIQVVAYGTNTRRYNLGSVSTVSAEDIGKQAVSNPLEALQGRVPGLSVSATSGVPGAAFNVQIRGQNTIRSSSTTSLAPRDNPLFIIDGVPFAPQNTSVNQFNSIAAPGLGGVFNNPYGGISPFNSINPADIESMEVLRDADATAIYGSRGGNGVILITTKKGRAGKTDFNLNVRSGVSFVGHTMPMMNTEQYLAMRKEAFANDGLVPSATLYDPAYAPDLTIFDQNRYTDWKKFSMGKTAQNTNAAASLSGGNTNTQFRLGAGFNRDTYIFPGDFADQRATFSANMHHAALNRKFTADFTINYGYGKNNSSGSASALMAAMLEPNSPELLDSNGNPVFNYQGVILDGSYAGGNPYSYLKRLYSITNTNLSGNLLLSYEILKGLTFRSSLGYNTFANNEYTNTPKTTLSPNVNPVSTARFGRNDLTTWILEPQLEYRKNMGHHMVNVLAGTTFQRNGSARTDTYASGYIDDRLLGSISGAVTSSTSDAYNEYKYNAIFARVSYRYDGKYLLNINGRRDGSSRFGPSRQFGNFGSVGAGWIFSEEKIVRNKLPILSYGKLRASYGITGSDLISDYQFLPRWSPTINPYGGNLGYTAENLFNPQLSWASTKKLEFGLETGLFKDRLLFTSVWFRNRSGDQLVTTQLPSQAGFGSVYENWGAVVQNSGWEFTLHGAILNKAALIWNSSFNLTIPSNKLLSFPGIELSNYSILYFVGRSLGTVTGFNYAGVNPATGLFQFTAADGQLTSTPVRSTLGRLNDYDFIGSTDPKFYGGWLNSFQYKGFQLDVFLEFKKQMGRNYLAQAYAYLPGQEVNLPVSFLDRWRAPGQEATLQRLSTQYTQAYTAANNFIASSGAYGDASYIRFKTATLSYNLPRSLSAKWGMQGLRIYATAQNLFTITGYQGNDPETQNFYGVPPLKAFSFGLNINL